MEQYAPVEKTPQSIPEFQRMVLSFYEQSGRHDMPWRHTTDPYHILVSEIMLQQTQVERVTVKYPAFIAAFRHLPPLPPPRSRISSGPGREWGKPAGNRIAEMCPTGYG